MTGAPPDLRQARDDVRARIEAACSRSGRPANSVVLVAVTKAVALERVREALSLGLTELGENRVQEAEGKVAALAGAPRGSPRWHMLGRLQSNKARRALELFDEVHSIDSLPLAERLSRVAIGAGRPPLPIYLQVNVDADPAKAGFGPADLERSIDRLAELPGLELRGLMTIGRWVARPTDARPTFATLRQLSERLRHAQPRLGGGLSMGMSDDFEIAVEEGATVVRIGRALFGERAGRGAA